MHDELVVVMRERAQQLHRRRRVRHGVACERQQRKPDGGRRNGDGGEPRGDAPGTVSLGERVHEQPAGERDAEEGRVGRVDEREPERRDPGGEQDAPRRPARVRKDEREDGRDEQLPRSGRRPGEQRVRPAVPRSERDDRTCAAAVATPSVGEPKSAVPASNAMTTASGTSSALSCCTTSAGSTPASFVTAARKACHNGKA